MSKYEGHSPRQSTIGALLQIDSLHYDKSNRIGRMQVDSEEHQQRLEMAKLNFRHVLLVVISVKDAAHGTKTDRQGVITDTLLLRNILTGVTISQALSPPLMNQIPRLKTPDFASIAVLARTILETSLTMCNISFQSYSKNEKELRLMWWDWYEVNEQIRALKNIRSKQPEVNLLEQKCTTLKNAIANHPSFGLIPDRLRNSFKKNKPPLKPLWESLESIAVNSGILPEHFDVQYQLLSSIAHSQPMVVNILCKHDPASFEATCIMIEAVQYATAYLAFSVCVFSDMFPLAKSKLDPRFFHIAKLWAGIFEEQFPTN